MWNVCYLKHTDILAFLSEYEVVSKTKGPNGEEVSILTTNQTHTAVENLKPESRYVTKTLLCRAKDVMEKEQAASTFF